MKKSLYLLASAAFAINVVSVYADNIPTYDDIVSKASVFASQYPYKESDETNTFSYGITYTSGFETGNNGATYECPAVYNDVIAMKTENYNLKKGEMLLYINDQPSNYAKNCILYNDITLVPVETFDEMGCVRKYDDQYCLTTLIKNNTVLEIIPYWIGMRKNQAEGYYVPLKSCARYVDDTLYIPLRAVAEELGMNVGWDGEHCTVSVNDL